MMIGGPLIASVFSARDFSVSHSPRLSICLSVFFAWHARDNDRERQGPRSETDKRSFLLTVPIKRDNRISALSHHPLTRLVEDYQLRDSLLRRRKSLGEPRGSRDLPPSTSSSSSSFSNEELGPSRLCSSSWKAKDRRAREGNVAPPTRVAASRNRVPSRAPSRYAAATAVALVAGVRGFPFAGTPKGDGLRPNICRGA